MNLKDKKILVTGSSSGIGRAIAIECAKQGSYIIVHYRKNKSGAEETLTEVEKFSQGRLFSADLTNPTRVLEMFKKFKEDSIDLDILVNNAGEALSGALDDWEMWESQWQNIFMSQAYVTNAFIKSEYKKGLRKIVNISSVYGLTVMGNPDFPQYSAAKAAVNSLTCTLAKKLAPSILVNAIAPGYTLTPAWEGTSEEELKKCASLTSIKRFVHSEEIAAIVAAVLQNDALTGEIIRVDGGLHLLDLR